MAQVIELGTCSRKHVLRRNHTLFCINQNSGWLQPAPAGSGNNQRENGHWKRSLDEAKCWQYCSKGVRSPKKPTCESGRYRLLVCVSIEEKKLQGRDPCGSTILNFHRRTVMLDTCWSTLHLLGHTKRGNWKQSKEEGSSSLLRWKSIFNRRRRGCNVVFQVFTDR